ncbi:MAG: type II toxin-antitoxin system RelE/ParE family toxin [Candidatus Thorarchaeota archaeon]
MQILISRNAEKQLEGLPKEVRARIKEIFVILREEGMSSAIEIRRLRGLKGHYRLRIGKYRVRFEFEKPDTIKIYWIGPRSQAYKD